MHAEADKPTIYKEKEDVDEIEEGDSATGRKDKGKTKKLYPELGKITISKGETGSTEMDKPLAYKEKEETDEIEEESTRREGKGNKNEKEKKENDKYEKKW